MIFGLKDIIATVGGVLTSKSKKEVDLELISTRGNITTLIGEYIIEPIVVVTEAAYNSSKIDDILDFNSNIFLTLYTNAFSYLVNVKGIEPKVAFRTLSSKSVLKGLMSTNNLKVVLENGIDEEIADAIFANEDFTGGTEPATVSNRDGKANKENAKLYKNILVKISVDGKTVEVPVIIKPILAVVSKAKMLDYVSLTTSKDSFFSQYHRYKSGRISGWEFFTASNLLTDYREKELKENLDAVDIMDELTHRKHASFGNNTATGIGMLASYGTLIISDSEKAELNSAIRGDISKERSKNELLRNIASYNIISIDDRFDVLKLYMSEIKGITTIDLDKLKSKSDSDKMVDVFKAMTTGSKLSI